MLKELLSTITGSSNKISSYRINLLQAKASRNLKQQMTIWLQPYLLSPLEWNILGLLFEHESGFRLQEIAELVGVEAPFVTVTIQEMETKRLVKRTTSKEDKRAQNIRLSAKGRKLVPKVEPELLKQTEQILTGTTAVELQGYTKVLDAIVTNTSDSDTEEKSSK